MLFKEKKLKLVRDHLHVQVKTDFLGFLDACQEHVGHQELKSRINHEILDIVQLVLTHWDNEAEKKKLQQGNGKEK